MEADAPLDEQIRKKMYNALCKNKMHYAKYMAKKNVFAHRAGELPGIMHFLWCHKKCIMVALGIWIVLSLGPPFGSTPLTELKTSKVWVQIGRHIWSLEFGAFFRRCNEIPKGCGIDVTSRTVSIPHLCFPHEALSSANNATQKSSSEKQYWKYDRKIYW